MLIEINFPKLKNEILQEIWISVRNMIAEEFVLYIHENEEVCAALQERFADIIKKMVVDDYKKELWDAFHQFRMEQKGIQEGSQINQKLEALARNQDALYLEIQELKRVKD